MKHKMVKAGLLLGLCMVTSLAAQNKTEAYIEKWNEVAQEEMQLYSIPASITLAQGILESGSGKSYLAREAKNHFGIKCHEDWDGKTVYRDDDKKDECFRSYRNARKSFRDHSLFLANRSRYQELFTEDPTDYKAWAKGLKKAGYATDRRYHRRLIDLIERYELHRFDQIKSPREKAKEAIAQQETEEDDGWQLFDSPDPPMPVKETPNRVDYIVVREGDTFESLAAVLDKRPQDLLRYNELRYDAKLAPGQRLYIQPKRNKAHRDTPYHVTKPGESMYQIAQRYGVKLRNIYRHNKLPVGAQPVEDQLIHLR
ncbi:MAG: glucosaminidase domain-containing protein [Schleiferiaceae bacterium]|nr:glucosaminidase domain-containing protein [Schleiferiaceae bacterium]MDR9441400.1 glucosaminidase domain-containing protein [Schleiferiaceae bacterium]